MNDRLENHLIFNRKYIDSFVVGFSASHASFQGGKYNSTFIEL